MGAKDKANVSDYLYHHWSLSIRAHDQTYFTERKGVKKDGGGVQDDGREDG